jgi:TolB-like protein
MNSLTGELSTVPQGAILEHLGKVLSSQSFQGAERSAKLLRFLVEQTVGGQSDRLKEYALATEALGRGSSFDPRTDTIVRAEVSRLRNRLDRYYASEGQADSLVIALSKGSYVPRFQKRTIQPDSVGDLEGNRRSLTKKITWLALSLGVAACLVVFVVWSLWRVPQADGAISIVVLPFANLSTEQSQEFFSDGMTDDIAGALAKIPDLRVVGRSSAFQFKGENKDLRAIGQTLGATHLIEGSVRQIDNQVRIAVQLIEAKNGLQLWSETYDRQLTDIFAIQEDIAHSIAASLRVPLGLAEGDTLVSNRTGNVESYQQYLRGKALERALFHDEAIKTLEPVVASDPSFAPAWAFLARAYILGTNLIPAVGNGTVNEARHIVQSYRIKGEMAAREAIRLDAKLAAGYWSLAGALGRGNYPAKEDLYRLALALDANDPETLNSYSLMLANTGRLKESLRLREQLRTQEPVEPVFNFLTAVIMRANGQSSAALPILEASRLTGPGGSLYSNGLLAQAYVADGRYAQAADTLLVIPGSNFVSRQTIEDAARLLRQAPATVGAPDALPVWDAPLSWIYTYVGAPDRILDAHERSVETGAVGLTFLLWVPEIAPVRKTERFKQLMRNAGIVDYWRQRGWPDLCHPVGADDFACD